MQKRIKRTSSLAIAIGGWLACTGVALAATPVFINELHYDNAGTDVGEAIEIAGPVGTDLTNWQVVLYNGSSGTFYDTIDLSGSIPANCSGMAAGVVVGLPPGGQIQNGDNDGLALIDNHGAVVQFLSYEGTLTATNGPASGMISTDIGVSEPSSTPAGQSLQLTGSGTVDSDFSWTGPVAASFGACNAGQTFGAAVDVPPTVASSTPANNASDVALAADIDIQFSEPVTLTASWFDLTCTSSGSHTAAVSGSGSSYTLNPDADFVNNETCTLDIKASKVVDQDGNADAMALDASISFQTVADNPPAVLNTLPHANSTVAASANLSVLFNEPVTLGNPWFSLVCDQSGSHTATVSLAPNGGYTLDPDTDFEPLENCTLTVIASAVTDTDGSPDLMQADFVLPFSIAGTAGGDYYAGVDTSSGAALLAWLHTRVTTSPPALGPTILAYPYTASTTDTWDLLNQAEEDPANTANILDVYANQSLTKIPGGQGPYNREHTWPNSLGFPNSSLNGKPNPPYTDIHMLHAANKDYNADRGNKPYANCDSGCTELVTEANGGFGGNGGGDSNWYLGPDGNNGSYEVWDHQKGDMARAVMYMAVRYKGGIDADGICEPDLRLTDDRGEIQMMNAQAASGCTGEANIAYMGLLTDILAWNDLDPPDNRERLRNDLVFSYQHNRNPFIDHPEWARCVFLNQQCPVGSDVIFANGFESGSGTP
ncbi:MAG TPA: endonuclease [Rhodanobacteraceae bacterium]|nr:endonuclease [Rhodanobacteraceae bacterium]